MHLSLVTSALSRCHSIFAYDRCDQNEHSPSLILKVGGLACPSLALVRPSDLNDSSQMHRHDATDVDLPFLNSTFPYHL